MGEFLNCMLRFSRSLSHTVLSVLVRYSKGKSGPVLQAFLVMIKEINMIHYQMVQENNSAVTMKTHPGHNYLLSQPHPLFKLNLFSI